MESLGFWGFWRRNLVEWVCVSVGQTFLPATCCRKYRVVCRSSISERWPSGTSRLSHGSSMFTTPTWRKNSDTPLAASSKPGSRWISPNHLRLCVLFSALTWFGDRKGIWPVESWVFVSWWWWFDWSFTRLIDPVVTTTSINLSLQSNRLTQAHLEKWPLKWREKVFHLCVSAVKCCHYTPAIPKGLSSQDR